MNPDELLAKAGEHQVQSRFLTLCSHFILGAASSAGFLGLLLHGQKTTIPDWTQGMTAATIMFALLFLYGLLRLPTRAREHAKKTGRLLELARRGTREVGGRGRDDDGDNMEEDTA